MCNEKAKFKSLVKTFIPYLNNRTKSIIEFYSCVLAYQEQPIYKISHKDDPEFDHSGRPVDTGECITKESLYTIKEIMGMYNGKSEASHISGCGLFHQINEEECQNLVDEFLYKFCEKLVEECIKHKLFINYFEKNFNEDCEFEDNVMDFSSDFVADFLFSYKDSKGMYIFEVGDKLKDDFSKQKIRTVYYKYNTYLYAYKKKFNTCKNHNDKVLSEYREIVDSIIIDDKFKIRIEKRTEVWKDLIATYNEKELSMLFKFNKLQASRSISMHYKNIFNQSIKDKVMKYPSQYGFLYRDIDDTILNNNIFA